jgi:predicted O-methyltransferase YrrM
MTGHEQLLAYAEQLFCAEDAALQEIRALHQREQLPAIAVSAEEGKLLHVLLRAVAARRVLEIGTLGGYSGVWIARALGAGGRLTTIEANPKHAAIARRAFTLAGVAERVELLEGAALDVLPGLEPGYDAVFVDADKSPLDRYYVHAMRLLRVGGLLLCDNAFFHARVLDPADREPEVEGVRAFNRLAAADSRVVATIVPVRDGLLVGVKTAAEERAVERAEAGRRGQPRHEPENRR